MAKKDLYKFTIQFSAGDPHHRQTAEMLNEQGRRKAQFLVNAVMHYLHCSETPDILQAESIDTATIESIVRRIMEETKAQPIARSDDMVAQPKRTVKSEQIDFGDAADMLGEEGVAAIAKTMANFRQEKVQK